MKWTILSVVAIFVLVGTVGTRAHHSYAEFSDNIVSVEGTPEKEPGHEGQRSENR